MIAMIRILGKSFENMVQEVQNRTTTLSPDSPEEIKYQKNLEIWERETEDQMNKVYLLMQAGKRGEAQDLIKKCNKSRPVRKQGFSGRKKVKLNYRIIQNALQTAILERALSSMSEEITESLIDTTIKRLCPTDKTSSKSNGNKSARQSI